MEILCIGFSRAAGASLVALRSSDPEEHLVLVIVLKRNETQTHVKCLFFFINIKCYLQLICKRISHCVISANKDLRFNNTGYIFTLPIQLKDKMCLSFDNVMFAFSHLLLYTWVKVKNF